MYLKQGKIVFEENVEKLQQMNPNKSIDIIIDEMYTSVMENLDVNNL